MSFTIFRPEENNLSVDKDIAVQTNHFKLTNKDIKDFRKNTIERHFSFKQYDLLKTEENILNHFFENESACLEYIKSLKETNDKRKLKFLKRIFFDWEEEEFTFKVNCSQSIKKKIDKINIKDMTIKEFNEILEKQFKTDRIPKFLVRNIKKSIEAIQFSKNAQSAMVIGSVKKTELIEIIEEMEIGRKDPFEFCSKSNYYFYFFFLVNRKIFSRREILMEELHTKLNEIKNFFLYVIDENVINDYDYNKIKEEFISISDKRAMEKINTCFDFFLKENKVSPSYILASYYYTIKKGFDYSFKNSILEMLTFNLFYVFMKGLKYKFNARDSVSHLQLYFLSQEYSFRKEVNETFDLSSIKEKIFDFEFLKDLLTKIKSNRTLTEKAMDIFSGIFTGKSACDKRIKLIPFSPNIHSCSITILISGFLSEEEEYLQEWINLIKGDLTSTMYYFYCWPSNNIMSIIKQVVLSVSTEFFLPGLNIGETFIRAKENAKLSGKILAGIIFSKSFFKDFSINLVGFSLGTQVIKSCIKELYRMKCFDVIKNVTFLGGATNIPKSNSELKRKRWNEILSSVVCGKIYNVFSNEDFVLKILYKICISETPIGLKRLDYWDIANIDISNMNVGHLDYRSKLGEIQDKIRTSLKS